jgi:hypothetical protein
MASVAPDQKVGSQRLDRAFITFFLAPKCSSRFLGVLGAEVDDTWDVSWRRCFVALALLGC